MQTLRPPQISIQAGVDVLQTWRGGISHRHPPAPAVTATPRHEVLGSGPRFANRPYDRVEVAVDAELGILLRRIVTRASNPRRPGRLVP